MKRILAVGVLFFVGYAVVQSRGDDKPAAGNYAGPAKAAPAAIIAPSPGWTTAEYAVPSKDDIRNQPALRLQLLSVAKSTIAIIKENAPRDKQLPAEEQVKCISLATDLAELGGFAMEAKRLREANLPDSDTALDDTDLWNRRQAQLDALETQVARLRHLLRREQRVAVDVRMIEISLTRMRKLGLRFPGSNWPASGGSGLKSVPWGLQQTPELPKVLEPGDRFFAFLDELQKKEIAVALAGTKMETFSGRPASFSSGGEFPVLRAQPNGSQEIGFMKYGTEINVLPTVIANGKIRLDVHPRYSELDRTLSITTGGVTVPGMNVRESDTTVELLSGQTIVLAGLVQTKIESDAPAADAAQAKQDGAATTEKEAPPKATGRERAVETELLMLVTARLVDSPPGEAAHSDLARPVVPALKK